MIYHVKSHATGENSFVGIPGTAVHNVRLALFHTQSKGGEGVGNQVDPQNVNGVKNGKSEDRCGEDGNNFTQIGCQQELNGFSDIVVNFTAFFYRRNDGGEVVVCKDHVGHVFRNVGSGNAHTDADIRTLNGRSIVDTVAGHGGDFAFCFPCFYDANFVFRLNPGIDRVFFHDGFKFAFGNFIQLGAGDGLRSIGKDVQFLGDGDRGVDVVPGNHHGTDSGRTAFFNGRFDLGTNRVDHAGQTYEGQIIFQIFRLVRGGFCAMGFHCQRQNTQCTVGHFFLSGKNFVFQFFRHRNASSVFQYRSTMRKDNVRRTLGILNDTASGFVNGGHHLSRRVEGSFADAGRSFLQGGLFQVQACGVVNQRTFRRFPFGSVFGPFCVGAKSHAFCQQSFVFAVMIYDGHLVLGQSTGFVGADDLGTTQGFYGCQFTNNRVAFGHFGNTDGQNDGNHRCQSFGDCRNRQRNGDHKGIKHHHPVDGISGKDNAPVFDDGEGKDEYADSENQPGQNLTQLSKFLLKGCLFVFRLRQRRGNFTHFRIHTDGGNYGFSATVNHGASHISHVFPIAQRTVFSALGKNFGSFCDGVGFPGQSRFFHFHGCGFQNADVCGDGVAGFQKNDVTHDQVFTLDVDHFAVTQDLRGCGGHFFQGFQGFFRLAFLNHAQNCVQQNDEQNDDSIGGEFRFGPEERRNPRNQSRRQKNNDHGVGQLIEKPH